MAASGWNTGDMRAGQQFLRVARATTARIPLSRTRLKAWSKAVATELLEAPAWDTKRNSGRRSAVVTVSSLSVAGPDQTSNNKNDPNTSTMTSATAWTSRVTPAWSAFCPGAIR